MRFVRVQYDVHNRQFQLADHEWGPSMGDGATYLIADLSPTDYLPADQGTMAVVPPMWPLSSKTDSGK